MGMVVMAGVGYCTKVNVVVVVKGFCKGGHFIVLEVYAVSWW